MLPGGSAWEGLQWLMQTLPFARQNCSSFGMIPKGFTYLKGKANARAIFRIFRSFESLTFTCTWRY